MSDGALAEGGAIYKNSGTLNLTNSSFYANIVGGSGGTIYNNSGTISIQNTSFNNSSSGAEGGAIYNRSGELAIANSSFTDNITGGSGGAIYNNGTLTINDGTSFTNNTANEGGAIYTTDYINLTINGTNRTINFSQNYSANPTSIEGNEELIGLHNNQIIGNYTTSITPYLYNNDDINFIANLLIYEPNSADPVQNLPPNVYYQTGQEVIISEQIPDRAGYVFSGWNTFPDGSGAQYMPGDSFIMPDERVALFAQWQPSFYTLAFDANTSDPVENLPPSINYTFGEIITIPNQTPIRAGYTFTGWNTASDGSGTQYEPGNSFIGPAQDSILYAQWTQNQNNLNFDPNTTDPVENLPENISYAPGDTVTIPNQIPTRDGYNFVEWNTSPDGTGTSYQPGDSFTTSEGDLTLYAQWEEEDTNLIIIVIIIGILLLLIFLGIILYLLYYDDCNCKTCMNKK